MRKFLNKQIDFSYYISKDNKILGRPELKINKANNNEALLNIERQSYGIAYENAVGNSNNILFDAIQKDSLLLIDPFFTIPNGYKWRAQQVELNLNLPVGTVIHIDNNIEPVLKEAEYNDNTWYKNLAGKTWVITNEGFASYNEAK